ncbi:MAG: hypothetical protein Q9188_005282 [Gyalolechia gomerana]
MIPYCKPLPLHIPPSQPPKVIDVERTPTLTWFQALERPHKRLRVAAGVTGDDGVDFVRLSVLKASNDTDPISYSSQSAILQSQEPTTTATSTSTAPFPPMATTLSLGSATSDLIAPNPRLLVTPPSPEEKNAFAPTDTCFPKPERWYYCPEYETGHFELPERMLGKRSWYETLRFPVFGPEKGIRFQTRYVNHCAMTTSGVSKSPRAEYKQLGKSGLRVSVPILGAMSFGDKRWMPWVIEEDQALPLLKAAYDQGLNTWDTANVYSNGASEEIIGKAIKKYNIPRHKLVILTKCCGTVREGNDPETLALKDIDQTVDYINQRGLSRGWTKFVSMQNYYNLLYREEEREMNKFCNETGVGLIPWSPLAQGALARPASAHGSTTRSSGKSMGETDAQIISRVEELAKKHDWKMSQVALAWINKRIASPIIGFSSPERINEALEVRGKELSEEDEKYLEEPYQPKPVMGHS